MVAQSPEGELGESGVIDDITVAEKEYVVNKKRFFIGCFSVRGAFGEWGCVLKGGCENIINRRGLFLCGLMGVEVTYRKYRAIEKRLQILAEGYKLKCLSQGGCAIRGDWVAEAEMGVNNGKDLIRFFITENAPDHSAQR